MAAIQSTRSEAVDAYIAKSAPFAQPILNHLRDIMHEAVPGVEEEIKWSRPFFVLNGVIVANISAFKTHCSLGLWGSGVTKDLRADGIARDDAMGSFGRITSLADLPPRRQLIAYMQRAANPVAEGTRTTAWTRTRVAKPEAEVPLALVAALARNKLAAQHFAAMSPSCRREYCAWVAEAKREETRAKRVAQAIDWITQGKSRNWKYETP